MKIKDLENKIPEKICSIISKFKFEKFRPSQEKAINQGLFDRKNMLICTPTASGKTLVGELGSLEGIIEQKGKAIYVVPLKALATEKYREFKEKYPQLKVAITSGDMDSEDSYLAEYDWIITTSEKLDSLIRHKSEWINNVKTLVIDEIHLLNDSSRGPTLEVVIILLKSLIKDLQLIGLSATIGNPKELADWLEAELVIDFWRPVELKQGVYLDGEIDFIKL